MYAIYQVVLSDGYHYIGQSGDLTTRMGTHRKTGPVRRHLDKHPDESISEVRVLDELADRRQAQDLERATILLHAEDPKLLNTNKSDYQGKQQALQDMREARRVEVSDDDRAWLLEQMPELAWPTTRTRRVH